MLPNLNGIAEFANPEAYPIYYIIDEKDEL